MAASFEFRVQFVDDVDPFNVLASLKHAEPTVPKKYKFASDAPLYDQIPGLKKLLRAPHKVSWLERQRRLPCAVAMVMVYAGSCCIAVATYM